jgi:signal peptidase I
MNDSLTPDQAGNSAHSLIWEFVRTGIIVLLLVIPIRVFLAQPFIVSGASMEPTFSSGDYLIVDQLSYRFNDPQRLDVVIFQYPNNPSKFYIKRLIGLPGETVKINGTQVTIINDAHPDGFTLDESYIEPQHQSNDQLSISLEDDEYFVLGDNRESSSDSRVWGVLPERLLVGKAFLQLLPPSEIDFVPGAPPAETND